MIGEVVGTFGVRLAAFFVSRCEKWVFFEKIEPEKWAYIAVEFVVGVAFFHLQEKVSFWELRGNNNLLRILKWAVHTFEMVLAVVVVVVAVVVLVGSFFVFKKKLKNLSFQQTFKKLGTCCENLWSNCCSSKRKSADCCG